MDHRPPLRYRALCGIFHLQPGTVRLQAPLEEPFGLLFLSRDEGDGALVEAGRSGICFDVGIEAFRVFSFRELLKDLGVAQCRLRGRRRRLGHG